VGGLSKRKRRAVGAASIVVVSALLAALGAAVVTGSGRRYQAPVDTRTVRSTLAAPPQCGAGLRVTSTPDHALDDLFQRYGNAGSGTTWTGGDGTESVALPDGRELWVFDDSLLGKVSGGSRPFDRVDFLHNSLVVEDHGKLTRTYYTPGGRYRLATGYIDPNLQRRFRYAFWPASAVVDGDRLLLLGNERYFYKSALTGNISGAFVATLALPSLARAGFSELPAGTVEDQYIAGTLTDGGYTYVYLVAADGGVLAARVPGTDLFASWSYYSAGQWVPQLSRATPIEQVDFTNHVSVTPVDGRFLYVARAAQYSTQILAAVGCSPVGPFGPPSTVYSVPEPAAYPASYGVHAYGAHAHPELPSPPGTLVVSYDVNFWAVHGLANPDSTVYRPRFITLSVSPSP
jgi:hypothetical protein